MNSEYEIERKYLVRSAPSALRGTAAVLINQGYLCLEPGGSEVRIRKKGDVHFLTVKGIGLEMRVEHEIGLSAEDFARLWPLTEGRRIEKHRHQINMGDHLIELDVYAGALAGLMVAEVEFASLEQASRFIPPPWFDVDVTLDPRYKNRNLALSTGDRILPPFG